MTSHWFQNRFVVNFDHLRSVRGINIRYLWSHPVTLWHTESQVYSFYLKCPYEFLEKFHKKWIRVKCVLRISCLMWYDFNAFRACHAFPICVTCCELSKLTMICMLSTWVTWVTWIKPVRKMQLKRFWMARYLLTCMLAALYHSSYFKLST